MSTLDVAARNWLPVSQDDKGPASNEVSPPANAHSPLPSVRSIAPSPPGLFEKVFGSASKNQPGKTTAHQLLELAPAYNIPFSPDLARDVQQGNYLPAALIGASMALPPKLFSGLLQQITRKYGPISATRLAEILTELREHSEEKNVSRYLVELGGKFVERTGEVYVPQIEAGRQIFQKVLVRIHEYEVGAQHLGEGQNHVVREAFLENSPFALSVFSRNLTKEQLANVENQFWSHLQEEVIQIFKGNVK